MSVTFKPNPSGSNTITLDQPGPTHLVLPTKQGVKEKVALPKEEVIKLLKLMSNPSLFPDSALAKMREWIEQSLDVYFDDLSTDEAKIEASKVLSFLLIDVIRPMFNKNTPITVLNQILDIEDAFFDVLKLILPSGADAVAFVKQREENNQRIQLFVKKIYIENTCNQLSEQKLYCAGNEMNQKNVKSFDSSKEKLSKFKKGRDVQILEVREALDVADKKVAQTTEAILTTLETAKTTSQNMQKTFNTFEQQRQDCLKLAREVTKL
jgi:hypothetical protein